MSGLNIDFNDLSANGSTSSINIPINGTYAVYISGTFGGGSADIEVSRDGVLFISVGAVTTDSRTVVELLVGETVRVTLSGATAPAISSGIV